MTTVASIPRSVQRQIFNGLLAGATVAQVARDFQISYGAVYRLRKRGLESGLPLKALPPNNFASLRDAGVRTGRYNETVSRLDLAQMRWLRRSVQEGTTLADFIHRLLVEACDKERARINKTTQ
jgi:transposase-like protein